ncbi:MAG TPA: methyltransferase domain-containing protein [Candidatus Kapabacteria bacterium]|nr:methyltransferase domain-containing protein [Candidatus Kapabacteria bacterium]
MSELDTSEFWESIYRAGDARWDLKTPTPVFVELQSRNKFTPGKMLIPGCGKGHDAVFFAQQGFDVTGDDIAESAIAAVQENARSAGVSVTALKTDIFSLGEQFPQQFDYVLEYTCFCAIDRARRLEYANMVKAVLKPGGLLIGLFFPIDGREGGPPFAVSVEEVTQLFKNDFILVQTEVPKVSVTPRSGKEILMLWKKKPAS